MNAVMTLRLVTICFVLLALVAVLPQEAVAQNPDQELAQQTGLGSKKFDESKMPGKLQYGIAIGSIIAAIAAFKYL